MNKIILSLLLVLGCDADVGPVPQCWTCVEREVERNCAIYGSRCCCTHEDGYSFCTSDPRCYSTTTVYEADRCDSTNGLRCDYGGRCLDLSFEDKYIGAPLSQSECQSY